MKHLLFLFRADRAQPMVIEWLKAEVPPPDYLVMDEKVLPAPMLLGRPMVTTGQGLFRRLAWDKTRPIHEVPPPFDPPRTTVWRYEEGLRDPLPPLDRGRPRG